VDLSPTRPRCLTGATCHNIQIRPHPPGQTSFYESIFAPMHAKWVLMCFGADQSDRIRMDFANLLFLSNAALHSQASTMVCIHCITSYLPQPLSFLVPLLLWFSRRIFTLNPAGTTSRLWAMIFSSIRPWPNSHAPSRCRRR
jgi:hypothetical protein